jgi:hypothetical protein
MPGFRGNAADSADGIKLPRAWQLPILARTWPDRIQKAARNAASRFILIEAELPLLSIQSH